MNKERLEWVMSGLNQHTLTKTEGQFVKTALENFEKNHGLTDLQEQRLETLYKEKSRLAPSKKSLYFSFKESSPKKTGPRRPRTKVF